MSFERLIGGATLGAELGDNFEDNGLSHLTLSVGGAYGPATISLNYIVETDDDVLEIDEDFYVSVGIGL